METKVIEIKFENFTRKGVEGCNRCLDKHDVGHFNCMYDGKAMGHSDSHCTASACY
jgi:hypothetical protein